MRKTMQVSWPLAVIFLLIWGFVTGYIPMGQNSDFEENEWATISHELYNFTLDYPTKWRVRTYDEDGYRGRDELKLRLAEPVHSAFSVTIMHQPIDSPTLKDAFIWGDELIEPFRSNSSAQANLARFEDISLIEDSINGAKITRRTYRVGELMFQDVYIARRNDILIVRLKSEQHSFQSYINDFNSVVASLRPVT